MWLKCLYLIASGLTLITSPVFAQYRAGMFPASELPANQIITNISELGNSNRSSVELLQSDQLLGPLMPSNPRVGRESRRVWIFFMYEASTGAVIPNATMVLGPLQPRANSGGHDHDSTNRPKGSLSLHTGFTGASGLEFQSIYTAPEVSGHVQSSISCTAPGYPPCDPGDYFVFVTAVQNLINLPPSSTYKLTGTKPIHVSNHWATASFANKWMTVANAYFMEFGAVLSINDISLPTGGMFDINQNWVPDHYEHRIGITADIGTPPFRNVTFLKSMLLQEGITGRLTIHPPPGPPAHHWHIREFDTRE